MNDEIVALKQQIETLPVGTYTFANGAIIKAISVAQPDFPPSGTTTKGLELVIVPGKDINAKPALNQGLFWTNTHEIIIKQWNERETTLDIIVPLVQLLVKNNYSVQVGLRLVQNPKIGNIESRNLTISKTFALRRPT